MTVGETVEVSSLGSCAGVLAQILPPSPLQTVVVRVQAVADDAELNMTAIHLHESGGNPSRAANSLQCVPDTAEMTGSNMLDCKVRVDCF